jgi:hypothetical protein
MLTAGNAAHPTSVRRMATQTPNPKSSSTTKRFAGFIFVVVPLWVYFTKSVIELFVNANR